MPSKLLTEIGKTPRLAVLDLLKVHGGLSTGELSRRVGLSYMGVKKHCVDLHQSGYVESYRRHSTYGRPELEYRLTKKAQSLFEPADGRLAADLLQISTRLFGPHAAEKLLFTYFQEKAEAYREKLGEGGLDERLKKLAALRQEEGYYSTWGDQPAYMLIDNHHPLFSLFDHYPSLKTMEHRMLEEVTGCRLQRDEETREGVYRCVFTVR